MVVSDAFVRKPISKAQRQQRLYKGKGYSIDGSKEGVIIFGLSFLAVLKLYFAPVSIRTTYICPYGAGAGITS